MSIFEFKIAAKLHKNPEISLIICSHNRAYQLDEGLPRYAQLNQNIPHEILVVLNACTDNSETIVRKHASENPAITFVEEHNVGASNARNTGFQKAKAPVVFYIDDDAYPNANLLDEIKLLLRNEMIMSFTGRTIYWRKDDPKWIKPEYVEMPLLSIENIPMHSRGHINGCACGFRKEVLSEVGGFHTDLDMKGKQIGYGVEEYIRLKILEAGYPTIYCPSLIVHHKSHSKTVKDFLKSSYYKGFYFAKVQPRNRFKIILKLCYLLLKGLPNFIINTIKLNIKNALVEYLRTPINCIGQIAGK